MIPFSKDKFKNLPSNEIMQNIYNSLKTPYKYGAVVKIDGKLCDSPSVFKYNGKWYMSFIEIDKDCANSGYDSHIAESDDLINWNYLFPTVKRNNSNNWDSKQIACYAAYINNDFNGDYEINKINNNYYFSYLGGNCNGYETDPLFMGLLKTSDILKPDNYVKNEKPILSPQDNDSRQGETLTLYKSNLFVDNNCVLGYKYVNAYNAKDDTHKEIIFLAVSNDGENWERYGETCVLCDETNKEYKICGDPQIIKINDVYVMLYFTMTFDGKTANTFACSYDLVNWKKWTGEPLVKPEYDWENLYAHKISLVKSKGVVYHFYCAVNDKDERFIALAISEKIK